MALSLIATWFLVVEARRGKKGGAGADRAAGADGPGTDPAPGQPVRFDGMFHPVGSDLTMAEARRSRINAFGIQYEGKTGLSKSEFSWAA